MTRFDSDENIAPERREGLSRRAFLSGEPPLLLSAQAPWPCSEDVPPSRQRAPRSAANAATRGAGEELAVSPTGANYPWRPPTRPRSPMRMSRRRSTST